METRPDCRQIGFRHASGLTAIAVCVAIHLLGVRAPAVHAAGHLGLSWSPQTSQFQDNAGVALSSRLQASQQTYSAAEAIQLTWSVTNVSQEDALVVSHYATNAGRQFDNLELRVVRQEDGRSWTLALSTPRKSAARIGCVLGPGETLAHGLDLRRWAAVQHSALGAGTFQIVAVYQVENAEPPMTDWARCTEIAVSESFALQHGPSRPPLRGTLRSTPVVIHLSN